MDPKLEKYPKTLKISEEPQKQPKNTRKKYPKSDPKIQNIPEIYLNTQIIFSENLKFYSKTEIIPKNLNLKLKKISEIPKIYQITYISNIYNNLWILWVPDRVSDRTLTRIEIRRSKKKQTQHVFQHGFGSEPEPVFLGRFRFGSLGLGKMCRLSVE